ncbi:tricarballylate dehydrogenase [Trichoderma arundinaceum]|uniref:Tricarballylate dehydrogenase n=1 Tax=Trichoderma arundinaceum TaxID=490622 RepID=A0A395NCH7_TRIAR|nr:tricarballylate dehydrogenase [Trichoderma arundinaceum]
MLSQIPDQADVLVIGGGNAGFCAAISATDAGAKRVIIVDSCPEDWAGGNTYFTAGAFRTVHGGLSDLLPIVNNVDRQTAKKIDISPYTIMDFSDDLKRVTGGQSDSELSQALIHDSNATIKWLAQHGVRFQLSFNRQAYEINGRVQFWGGLALKTENGGKGLIEDYKEIAKRLGINIFFSHTASRLVVNDATGAVQAVELCLPNGQKKVIQTGAAILAAGGFEANPRMRAQYLGPYWDVAKVRGTPYNQGACLEIAIRDVSAKQAGNWSGCHSVAWDANAPSHEGNREVSNEFTKSGYPLGIMVNRNGERFVDEGLDMRNYTYAIFGKAILNQPGNIAFQVYDSQTIPWLRLEEYRDGIVEKITAATLPELVDQCVHHGLTNPYNLMDTITTYNEAVIQHRQENPAASWNPAVKDGLSTLSRIASLPLAKSNWATTISKGPFLAVKVTCGITFTFGGLTVDPETAGVISSATNKPVPGLYCAGEMVGGLFYDNYPGGSGLTSGAVFGRRAGRAAAALVV